MTDEKKMRPFEEYLEPKSAPSDGERAVLRSIEEECRETARSLGDEITSWAEAAPGDRKVRRSTMQSRAARAEQTESKMSLYEAMLGRRLDGLHAEFEQLQGRIAQAILAADADVME